MGEGELEKRTKFNTLLRFYERLTIYAEKLAASSYLI